jgi:hypothetical protein
VRHHGRRGDHRPGRAERGRTSGPSGWFVGGLSPDAPPPSCSTLSSRAGVRRANPDYSHLVTNKPRKTRKTRKGQCSGTECCVRQSGCISAAGFSTQPLTTIDFSCNSCLSWSILCEYSRDVAAGRQRDAGPAGIAQSCLSRRRDSPSLEARAAPRGCGSGLAHTLLRSGGECSVALAPLVSTCLPRPLCCASSSSPSA